MILRIMVTFIIAFTLIIFTHVSTAQGSPRIEIHMEGTHIRSNQELPKLLYIIPWRDTDLVENSRERKILIPDLFSDYYQPLTPSGESDADTQDRS